MAIIFNPIQPIEKMSFSNDAAQKTPLAVPFKSYLQNAMQDVRDTQEVVNQDGYRLAMGDVNNLAQIQINAQKAEAVLQTTVQLTTRFVNAYKDIMQMQI